MAQKKEQSQEKNYYFILTFIFYKSNANESFILFNNRNKKGCTYYYAHPLRF